LIELEPVIKRARLNVDGYVIDRGKTRCSRRHAAAQRMKTRQECTRIFLALDKRMHGVTACGHRSLYDLAVRVFNKRRLKNRSRPAYDGLLNCLRRIRHRKGYISHAVAVQPAMFRDIVVGFESARQHQPDVSLLENKRHAIAQTRLKPGIRYRRKSKRGP